MDLSAIAAEHLATFLLVFARVGGVFALAPVFASRLVPMRIRLVLGLAVSLVAVPAAENHPVPFEPMLLGPLMLKEALVGTALAFGVAGVFAAVEMAGSLLDTTIGFAMANVVDPSMNFNATVISSFYGMLASLVFLGTGAHQVLIAGVVRSFDVLPVDQTPNLQTFGRAGAQALIPMFGIALEIASPVIATLFLTDVGFGLLARLVPQLQPMAVQFSVKILVGLTVMALSLPVTLQLVASQFDSALANGGMFGGIGP
jgi:flagellar biosynthesis protein FliR